MNAAVTYNRKRPIRRSEWRGIQAVVGAEPDGIPGPATAAAVAVWQRGAGLVDDGMVGPATLARIRLAVACQALAAQGQELTDPAEEPDVGPCLDDLCDATDDAKEARRPPLVSRWGYHHAEMAPYPYRDGQWLEVTGTGSWEADALRLVTGVDVRRGTCSRGPDSWISLDGYSIGIAHWWSGSAPGLLARIATELPAIAAAGWGTARAQLMRDRRWLEGEAPARRGHMPHDPRLDWLLEGWWAIARLPAVVELQCRAWLEEYVGRGRRAAASLGWTADLGRSDGGRVLAGLTRAANSGKGAGKIRRFDHGDGAVHALARFYRSPKKDGGYGHPERWQRILSSGGFRGRAPEPGRYDLGRLLDLGATPRRHDGSPVVRPECLP